MKALNPYYAYQMLVNEPKGFWLLGNIFLCTTGAEDLYSDMGHAGRNNIKNDVYYIQFDLGFREEPRIGYYFKQVVNDMIKKNEIDVNDSLEQAYQQNKIGDFKFIMMDSFLSYDNKMPLWKNFVMRSYYNLRHLSIKDHINFGLDKSHLEIEQYPLVVVPFAQNKLERREN